MLYLNVGTDEIRNDSFKPLRDGEEGFYKPTGGFWLTQYDPKYANYNMWVDYLIDNPQVLFYKSHASVFQQPCAIVELREDAKIYTFKHEDNYRELLGKYPLYDSSFSYEAMSKDYDGIYVDLHSLFNEVKDKTIGKIIRQYCVSTLLLYNLDCIDYYYSGGVDISPFD